MAKTTLAERFKRARTTAGLSQEEAAAGMGVSGPFISQVEAGKKGITIDNLKKAAEVYKVSPSYLIGRTLPCAAEITHAIHIRLGQLPAWYVKLQFDLTMALAEMTGFDAEGYCDSLGMPFGPIALSIEDEYGEGEITSL